MASSMKERLARIRLASRLPKTQLESPDPHSKGLHVERSEPEDFPPGWKTIEDGLRFKESIEIVPDRLPGNALLLGAFTTRACAVESGLCDLLFFDLETTGLSGGSGTVAFLAALGVFMPDGRLVVRQYFMDDYPAEPAFLSCLDAEFSKASVIITYNGASFDMPLYSVRRVMNGLGAPPILTHVDVIHAARRLWRHTLRDCSLGNLEAAVLGIKRTGDIPGAEVPAVWFDFLKKGVVDRLKGVFSHNEQDVRSLAALFLLMHAGVVRDTDIAHHDPIGLAELQARLDYGLAEDTLRQALGTGNNRAVRPLMRIYRKQGRLAERIALIPLLPDDSAGLFSKSVYAERILCDLEASKIFVDRAALSSRGVLKERSERRAARLTRKLAIH